LKTFSKEITQKPNRTRDFLYVRFHF